MDKKMDCILFSNLSYLLIQKFNRTYGSYGSKKNLFKYLSIKKNKYGDGKNDFHQFITFKHDDIWYYLDRFECKKWDRKIGKKHYLEEFNGNINLSFYIRSCGFKNQLEAEEDIFTITRKHLFNITNSNFF